MRHWDPWPALYFTNFLAVNIEADVPEAAFELTFNRPEDAVTEALDPVVTLELITVFIP